MTACSSRRGTKDEKTNQGARRLRKEMDRHVWHCLLNGEGGTRSSGTVFRSTVRGLRSGRLAHDVKEFDLEH